MRGSNDWGGNLEVAAFAVLKEVHVHVYRMLDGELRRTTCVQCPTPTENTIHIVYKGMCHYDLIEGGRIEMIPPAGAARSSGFANRTVVGSAKSLYVFLIICYISFIF